jgi:hypothetical protein
MKNARSLSHRKPTFAAYAIASAAASVVATQQAAANFSDDYAVTPPAPGVYLNSAALGAFGAWTGSFTGDLSQATFGLDTASAPTSVSFAVTTPDIGGFSYSFLTTAASSGTVSFSYDATYIEPLFASAFAEYFDGSSYFFIPAGTGMFSFSITAGQTFGFVTSASYLGESSLTIFGFSAPGASVPEGGSALALLALGFAGLLARREWTARAQARV